MDDIIDAQRSCMVLVDYQARLMPAIAGAQAVIDSAALIAHAARELGIRAVATEQNPARLGATVAPLQSLAGATIAKTHFDACEDGLADAVGGDARHIVIAGCESHVCLLQTALGLLRRGHRLWVVGAACGSRRHSEHQLAMQRLAQAGAVIVSPEMVLFEWLRSFEHAQFKSLHALIKAAPLGS